MTDPAIDDELESLGEFLPRIVSATFDSDLRYLTAYGLGADYIAFAQELLVGKTIFEAHSPDVWPILEPAYRAGLEGIETSLDLSFGGRVFAQRYGPLLAPDGTIVGGVAFSEDVTLTRELDLGLRRSEELLRVSFDQAPIGKSLISLGGGFERVNRMMCQIFGYPEWELLRLGDADVTDPADFVVEVALWPSCSR